MINKEVDILDKTFVPFITADVIATKIEETAAAINRDYAGKKPLLIAILNGSFMFLSLIHI